MGDTYTEVNGYLIPDIEIPAEETKIGIWIQRHLRYLKEYHRVAYTNLPISGKLKAYFANIDEQQVEDTFFRLVKELAEKKGITEKLKAENQMLLVQWMNAVQETATEIDNNYLIYN